MLNAAQVRMDKAKLSGQVLPPGGEGEECGVQSAQVGGVQLVLPGDNLRRRRGGGEG